MHNRLRSVEQDGAQKRTSVLKDEPSKHKLLIVLCYSCVCGARKQCSVGIYVSKIRVRRSSAPTLLYVNNPNAPSPPNLFMTAVFADHHRLALALLLPPLPLRHPFVLVTPFVPKQ